MKNKLLISCVIIVLGILAFGTISASAESDTCGTNLTWNLDSKGTLTISGTGDMADWGYYAFVPWYSNRASIKNVIIEKGVTSIGSYAFYDCDSLPNVTIGSDVTSIGSYAFGFCDSLASITIPDSVTSIGSNAFCYCDSLASVTIGSGVTSIGSYAFSDCDSLTSIEIPDSVTSIGGYVFYDCDSLASITIPDSVTIIGSGAFYSCDSLTSINVDENNQYYSSDENGVLFNKDKTTLIRYPNGSFAASYIIPDSVTSIGNSAFAYCYSLASIEIPDSVTSIGSDAFEYCDSLTSIEIPDSVTIIGVSAFSDCDSLTSIEIPDSVTSIGGYVFYDCDSLASITIPDSVASIGGSAFRYCYGLESVTIGSGVTSIGSYAFYDCGSLTNITIPDSVTSIGEDAFYSCYSLESVNITDIAAWCNISFSNYSSNPLYYAKNLYLNGEVVTELVIPDSVISIGSNAFSYCDSLESITIPDSVASIGGSAFRYCYSIKTVYYNGTQAMWNKISIGSNNSYLTSANRIYVVNVKIVYEDGEEVSFTHTPGTVINASYIPVKPHHTPVFYKDENHTEKISVDTHISKNTTLYLVYEKTLYTYSFLDNDGTVIKTESVPYGTIITPPEAPEKAPTVEFTYTFAGWEGFTDGMVQSGETLTFTAIYTAVKNKYTYSFLDDDGNVIKSETIEYGSVITPPEAPTKAPTVEFTYTFAGWEGFTEGMVQSDSELTFTATYTATKNKYTYIFTDDDGTVLKSEKAEYGTSITPPEAPEDKEPYTFDYWADFVDGMSLTENIEFVAVYKYKTYEIDVDGYDISASAVYADKFEIEPANKEDYNFIGYYTEENGNGTKLTDENGTSLAPYEFVGNITVYPYFEHSLLGKMEIAEDTDIEIGESFNVKPSFATDASAQYIYMTVGIPDGFTVKEIIPVDFAEISPDSEEHKNGYTYYTYLGIYDYNGTDIPKNQRVVPFEMVIDCSTSVVKGDYLITLSDVSFIDNNGEFIPFENVNGATVTVKAKLAESITIIGPFAIDKPTSFSATIYPEYTSENGILWSVDDETVAKINENGVLTPIKNGTVIVSATAADGSGCVASKSVEIIKYAEITSLSSDVGMWDKAFSPDVYEYTIAVFGDVSSITLTPTFNGGVLRPNGTGLWISGTKKSFALGEDTTTITLVRQNVTDNTNSTYTVNVVKAKSEFVGAQIRTDDPQGLRFIFSIPRAIYDMLEHPKSPDDKGIGFGSVVMPKKYLGDNELTKETAVTINNKVYKSKIAPAVNLFEITDDEVKFTVCVIEIPEKNYSEEYVAIPYMTYIENGEEITVYGEKTEGITVFTIAEMAYADNKTSEVDKEYLYNNILSVVDPKKYPTNK